MKKQFICKECGEKEPCILIVYAEDKIGQPSPICLYHKSANWKLNKSNFSGC
jgi:hypothetical protein